MRWPAPIPALTMSYGREVLQSCRDPFDTYALHKAALLACGIVPLNREATLEELLEKLGGGLYLSTAVMGIPRGSGLGTSSIWRAPA